MVIHQLPVVPETLFLRLLGREAVQSHAVQELLQLPEQPLRDFILEKITKFQLMLKNRNSLTLSKADEDIMLNIEPIYQAWLNENRQEDREEGDRASLEAMLAFKFGAIDPALQALIPKLLLLDPLERVQQVMTLSREVLLKS